MDSASRRPDLDLLDLSKNISSWLGVHGRHFPWTETRDPYLIWISEIMLHQTVINAVLDHYRNWILKWPNLESLAMAQESEVLRTWEGLGYYSRARNLLKATQQLVLTGHKNLPLSYAELIELPGMGDYTASAVLSFSIQAPLLTIDGNLKRVFQRFFAQRAWTKDWEKILKTGFSQIFSKVSSREVNQGLMQLGQLICRPTFPSCGDCPLKKNCQAFSLGLTGEIPEKKVRTSTLLKSRVLILVQNSRVFLTKKDKGLMKDLWTFPRHDVEVDIPSNSLHHLTKRVHSYTRFKEELYPVLIFVTSDSPVLISVSTGEWKTWEETASLAMPSVYRKIWKEALDLWSRNPG